MDYILKKLFNFLKVFLRFEIFFGFWTVKKGTPTALCKVIMNAPFGCFVMRARYSEVADTTAFIHIKPTSRITYTLLSQGNNNSL